jgi:1-acyl-sn-glycerol-3-phosphate acyltransferase
MLDLARIERIRLSAAPKYQRLVAMTILAPNYRLLPGVEIVLEDQHRVPPGPVIFAMNHTDRFNYFPFQYRWWRERDRYTATWVKGKYYENPVVAAFMENTNNIPTVSRGYLITKDFILTLGRRPSGEEYEKLRTLVEAAARGQELPADPTLPSKLFTRARDMLGRPFDPSRESYAVAVDALFRRMMSRFVDLNEEASDLGLDILIFPQGTRSIRLSRGHVGLAQMAMHLERPVVPVGCNGSDRVYPGSSPIARRGRIVYRFGDPIAPASVQDWVPRGTFEPFTPEAEAAHGETFQRYVDDVMEKIDALLDPEYQFSPDRGSSGVEGSHRFV